MAEFVKKPAIGGYKPVTGGSSDSECTHVILTLGEYTNIGRGCPLPMFFGGYGNRRLCRLLMSGVPDPAGVECTYSATSK